MKVNEANIFVFIAAIIIGILISLNINLSDESERVVLSVKQYQEASNLRNKLIGEVSSIKEGYYNNVAKLEGYKLKENDKDKIVEEITNEIDYNKNILGYSNVKGPGLKITLIDAAESTFINEIAEEDFYTARDMIIHNTDMLNVINEIKNAGAEAISINGQRVLSNSKIDCSWAFLSINGVRTPAPFYITAIGNKEVMKKYLLSSESHLKGLMNRGINVTIYEEDEVEVPAYDGDIKVNDLNYYSK
ncbi:DUF881 domain-containing protein [Clostridium sp.]|uniref:DUF881 domain-containing protein n=1 Tax=Clostridium sp. TaxID=1506 RepID=UPI003463A9AE